MGSRNRRDVPGVIAPPPLIYAAGIGIGFALETVLPSTSIPDALRWPLGGALVVGGVALQASFIAWFRRARTPVAPYQPTRALVTTGPYRLSRNPAYLGFTLISSGIAFLADALWVLAPLPVVLAVMQWGVIAREERYLDRRFGDNYRRYRARTRRWL
jgi:protein-S-isoprenylcysteine O-methyltransferase Ste14